MPIYTFPSGLEGEIRELSITEENLLANQSLARKGENVHQVFGNCWLKTINAVHYDFGEDKFSPIKLLQGDGMYYLMLLRIESFGPRFEFDINCPMCGRKISWELDLNDFLAHQTKILPEESKRILREEKGLFHRKLPRCGRNVSFRLPTLKDEQKFPEIQTREKDRIASFLLDIVIQEIEGIVNKRSFLGIDPAMAEGVITSFDANWIRQELEVVNCGVETEFEIECPADGELTVNLPFRGDFFFPRRHKKRSK
jgi:hypothetical protein